MDCIQDLHEYQPHLWIPSSLSNSHFGLPFGELTFLKHSVLKKKVRSKNCGFSYSCENESANL